MSQTYTIHKYIPNLHKWYKNSGL